jgi:ferredoxin
VKPVVDRDTCIGAASCVGVAPDVFQLDEEFKSTVVDPDGADEDILMQAAEACPVQAITLLDDEGNQVYP